MATKFSPFDPTLLACATSENFGVVGNSLTYFLKFDINTHTCQSLFQIPTKNAVFDIAFSESVQDLLFLAGGDGIIKGCKIGQEQPIMNLPVHEKEIHSIEINSIIPNLLLTASMDSTMKVVDIEKGAVLASLPAHQGVAYQAVWHPRNPDLAASCGQDKMLKVWNLKQQKPVMAIPAHNNDI